MRVLGAWASIAVLLLAAACTAENVSSDGHSGGGKSDGGEDGDSGTGASNERCMTGDEGCACYPNDTCNEDLTCASDLCVRLPGTGGFSSGGDGAGGRNDETRTGGEEPCVPGDEGCACYPNDTCNDDLTCASNLCVQLPGTGGQPATGGKGGTAGGGGGAGDGLGGADPERGGVGGESSGRGGSAGDAGGHPGTGGVQPGTGGICTGPDSITTACDTAVLSELTDEEATQLCEDIWAYYAEVIDTETFCRFLAPDDGLSISAHSDDELKAYCAATETNCLADPESAWPSDLTLFCGSIPADCGATMAEYTTCIQDVAANFNTAVPGLPTCEEITLTLNSEVWDFKVADRQPSCTAQCSIWPPDPRDL